MRLEFDLQNMCGPCDLSKNGTCPFSEEQIEKRVWRGQCEDAKLTENHETLGLGRTKFQGEVWVWGIFRGNNNIFEED